LSPLRGTSGEDENTKIVSETIEVINLLALHPENRILLANAAGLLPKLRRQMLENFDIKTKKLAITAYTTLQNYAATLAPTSNPEDTENDPAAKPFVPHLISTRSIATPFSSLHNRDPSILSKTVRTTDIADGNRPDKNDGDSAVLLSSGNGKENKSAVGIAGLFSETSPQEPDGDQTHLPPVTQARTHTLYVKGLNSEDRKSLLETALLTVRGIVSFLIDIYNQKVTIRSLTSLEEIVRAISSTGMTASLEDKENVLQFPYSYPSQFRGYTTWGITPFGTSFPKKTEKDEGWFGKISKAIWGS